MATNFRRSKKVGPFRVTASKNGLGFSAGAGPVRVSRSPKGKVTRTVRVPGTGVYNTKVLNSGGGRPSRPGRGIRRSGQNTGAYQAGAFTTDGGFGTGDGNGLNGGGGRPRQPGKNGTRNGCLGLFVVAFLILWGIGSCMGGSSSSSTTSPEPTLSSATSETTSSSEPTTETPTSDTSTAVARESTESAVSTPTGPSTSDASVTDAPPTDTTTPATTTPEEATSSTTAEDSSPDPSSEAVPPSSADSTPSATSSAPAYIVPQETTSAAPANCYPLTNAGNCYHIHEFCRKKDIGTSGVDVNGTHMTCVADGKRGRWS